MGIARLSQDLYAYAEHDDLGRSIERGHPIDGKCIKLIIDGPSLAFFVYNRLLARRILNEAVIVPSYGEINAAARFLLHDFQNHGLQIERIFFDGRLPARKREIRLERMEKARRQLELFRRTLSDGPRAIMAASDTALVEETVWNPTVLSSRQVLPPPPPFMVPALIESLNDSTWASRVRLVPGEADGFCARAAANPDHAILTNDSDLCLYGLGPDTRIVQLNSLHKKSSSQQTVILATVWQPAKIAERLRLVSLTRLGFERFMDSTVSFRTILERARDSLRLEALTVEYRSFLAEYSLPSEPEGQNSLLGGIDPRLSELIVDFEDSSVETATLFLTPLLEDPSRDSSWSYGVEYRALAYSLLNVINEATGLSKRFVEYARRGQRIAESPVRLMETPDMRNQISTLVVLLSQVQYQPSDAELDGCLRWHAIAFLLVSSRKISSGKSGLTVSYIQRLLKIDTPTANLVSERADNLSWDDLHVLANAQAVLYSLRILHQVVKYVLMRNGTSSLELDESLVGSVNSLLAALDSLPAIQELFVDFSILHSRFASWPQARKEEACRFLAQLNSDMNPVDFSSGNSVSHGQKFAPKGGESTKQKRRHGARGKGRAHEVETPSKRTTGTRFSVLMDE